MKIKVSPSILASIILPFMLLFISSCDKKEDNNSDQRPLRIKQLINEYSEGGPFSFNNDTLQFEYNDKNQLIAVLKDEFQESYRFKYNTDGTISEAEYNADEEESNTTFFVWSGNKVTITESDNIKKKTVFEVNAEREIIRVEDYYQYQEEWIMRYYINNDWNNGNLISSEIWLSDYYQYSQKPEKGSQPFSVKPIWEKFAAKALQGDAKTDFQKVASQTHTYDDKTNPFKDVPMFRWSEGHTYTSKNNLLSTTYYSYNSTGSIDESSIVKSYYTYNAKNYPLKKSEVNAYYTYYQTIQYE